MATVYSYVFPFLYLHSPEFYVRTLLTSIGSNIIMTLLKWSVNNLSMSISIYQCRENIILICYRILSEGRPYWYVFSMPNRPILRQTEITCETSSGNPSGHFFIC